MRSYGKWDELCFLLYQYKPQLVGINIAPLTTNGGCHPEYLTKYEVSTGDLHEQSELLHTLQAWFSIALCSQLPLCKMSANQITLHRLNRHAKCKAMENQVLPCIFNSLMHSLPKGLRKGVDHLTNDFHWYPVCGRNLQTWEKRDRSSSGVNRRIA